MTESNLSMKTANISSTAGIVRNFLNVEIKPYRHLPRVPNTVDVKQKNKNHETIEYQSDDVIKMKFLKLWDLSGYSERTISKTPT